jgi:N-hydroxyarylamine O-acetyltransferase
MLSHDTKEKFNGNIFSAEKYFSYIGLSDFKPSPQSLDDLNLIIRCHLNKFIYQNTPLYESGKISSSERKVSSLDINELSEYMFEKNGGYCFQHLELLYNVLSATGFSVDRHLTRTILKTYSNPDPDHQGIDIKTHELLVVHINATRYIVDVGMANMSMRSVLELKAGDEQYIDNDQYRLSIKDGMWTLDTKNIGKKDWFCIYEFFNTPVQYKDIKEMHQNLILSEKPIPIRDERFLVAKVTDEKRKYAIWYSTGKGHGLFSSVKAQENAQPKVKTLDKFEDMQQIVKKKFGM